MKKTISINLGGIVFQIDDSAYDKLHRYLESIKSSFSHTEGSDEILSDIESRIGEMFSEKLGKTKEVISDEEVDAVISRMGRPEQFESADEEEVIYTPALSSDKKRLFRNPDDSVLGGVCSGMSAYLGISDPIWMRLLFVLLFIFGVGSSLIIYIILWLIMPEAKTAADKLEMRGENVTLSNIERTVKEEMSNIKKKLGDLDTGGQNNGARNFLERVLRLFVEVLKFILKFTVKLIGVLFIFIGIILFLALFFSLIPVSIVGVAIPDISSLIFANTWHTILGLIGISLLTIIPAIALFYIGLRILFNTQVRVKRLGITLLALWIGGLILSSIIGGFTGAQFRSENRQTQKVALIQPVNDTLYLQRYNEEDMLEKYGSIMSDEFAVKDDLVYMDAVEVDVVKSSGNKYELVMIRSARGASDQEANNRVENINYEFEQSDSVVFFNDYISFDKEDKLRCQELRILLKVPEGSAVFLDKSMKYVINDIKNVHDMWDPKMVNHYWYMGKDGLTCLDCIFDDEDGEVVEGGEETNIRINRDDKAVKITIETDMEELEDELKDGLRELQEGLEELDEEFENVKIEIKDI